MYRFLIPLLLGFALGGASAFTAAFSRLWGERGGRMATMVLRNLLAIPLWLFGFVLAWRTAAPLLFVRGSASMTLGWLLIAGGAIPVVWGHISLGLRTHMPSVRDTLVRRGFYAHVRHPIYAGMILIFVGLALLKPTSSVVVACAVGVVWAFVQARLEEIDLVSRLPAYRAYMKEVPRFIPNLGGKGMTGP
jgi:protein-S-isoprenylcysteine O-methyltransferase Ste14